MPSLTRPMSSHPANWRQGNEIPLMNVNGANALM